MYYNIILYPVCRSDALPMLLEHAAQTSFINYIIAIETHAYIMYRYNRNVFNIILQYIMFYILMTL